MNDAFTPLPPLGDGSRCYYGKLQRLPLFIGMSPDELSHVVEKTKFTFNKVAAGSVIVHEGDPCGRFIFLITGQVLMEARAADNRYTVIEEQKIYDALEPECAFGLSQRFTHTFRAVTDCSFVSFDKNEALHLTAVSLIFRLNVLNLLSTALQKEQRQTWHAATRTTAQRVIRFFNTHCRYPAGRKVFRIKMTTLAEELNCSRLQVSECLNDMKQRRWLSFSRGIITIPALEKLAL